MNTEAPFEMANLFPKHTGLSFVVWISVKGGARHDVRIKVSNSVKVLHEDMVTVAIRPYVHVIKGDMDTKDFTLLELWITLNRATLIAYWEGEIDTQDAIEKLVRI